MHVRRPPPKYSSVVGLNEYLPSYEEAINNTNGISTTQASGNLFVKIEN